MLLISIFETRSPALGAEWKGGYPGFFAFPSYTSADPRAPADLAKLIAAIGGVNVPESVGPLQSYMPPFVGVPSSKSIETASSWKTRYFGGLITAACSLELFYLKAPGPLFGAAGVAAGAWFGLKQWDVMEPYRKLTAESRRQFDEIERKWQQTADVSVFHQGKRNAQQIVSALQNLTAEEQKRLNDLQSQLRARQLNQYLERHYIEKATIKGIAGARKLTLRSYGVETAADVSAGRIKNIPGFGAKIAGEIIAWRTALERRFVYDPRQPLNPADIAKVKADIAQQRSQKHTELKEALPRLRAQATAILQGREQLKAASISLWVKYKQAELDELAAKDKLPSSQAYKWGFGAALFVSLIVLANVNASPRYVGVSNIPQTVNPLLPAKPSISASANTRPETSQSDSGLSARPVAAPISVPIVTAIDKARSVANPPADANLVAKTPDQLSMRAPSSTAVVSPFPTPVEIKPAPGDTAIQEPKLRSLSIADDVVWLQKRLAGLGYLRRYNPSILDKDTREALRDFRVVNKLSSSDAWNLQVQQALEGPLALGMSDSFLGVWSENPQCDASRSSIVISSRRAQSPTGGYCDFLSVTGTETGWKLRTKCSDSGQNWTATIKFSVASSQLIWDGKTGVTKYYRCR